jgi:PTH1 family peptidyl-tRNA hydrolase
MRSLIESLGGKGFPRVRVGIGRPGSARVSPDYVVGVPSPEEGETLEKAVEVAADAIEVWIGEGIGEAMNRFNGG